MKKISLLVLSGLFAVTCVTAADRKRKAPAKGKTSVKAKQVKDDAPATTQDQASKRVKKEQSSAPAPSPMAMHEAVASSSSGGADELTWEAACATKMSHESLHRIMASGIAPFKRKQQDLVKYLIDHGFSPLVAACFIAFDFSDVQMLLPDGAEDQIPAFLANRGFVPNASELNLFEFFKSHITPFMFLAMNGRSINEILKWVVTRVEMFSTLEKGASGLHALIISGVGAEIINAIGPDIKSCMTDVPAGCPTIADCVRKSQSIATVSACRDATIIDADAQLLNLATPAEDLATLQSLGMEQVMGKFNVGEVADSLDIDAFIASIDVKSLTGQVSAQTSTLQPRAGALVETLKLQKFLGKISSLKTLNLILDKLAEAELLSSGDLMKLGAKLTALGAARGASSGLSSVGRYFFGSATAKEGDGDSDE